MNLAGRFSLSGRVAIITGGGGLLGAEHAAAVAEAGGVPVLWDIDIARAGKVAAEIEGAIAVAADITDRSAVEAALAETLEKAGRVDVLINNAANNPTMKPSADGGEPSRFEGFAQQVWDRDLAVGLTGAMICAQVVGGHFARQGGGVIVNIASDLGLIAPDQRIYRKDGLPDDRQPVKPVTYSVVKHGLIGLTRYLATYWAGQGVRVNALCPGGIYDGQPDDFVEKLTGLIPMGRMANRDEYRGAVQFLCSDASAYMTGGILSVDGGRTVW